MDEGQDASAGDGGADEGVELLVAADGELQMARGDALHAQIFGCVACILYSVRVNSLETYIYDSNGRTGKLEDLGGEVLQDGGGIHGGLGANAGVVLCPLLEITVDTTNREL